jgi:DNA-binding MarR family transcriptional regulator
VAYTIILNFQEIGQAQRATSAIFGAVLAEHGTTIDQLVVLYALATGSFPPKRARLVPELAGALATGPTEVEALLDQAEAAGLARIVSAPDGRRRQVELTSAGRAQHGTLSRPSTPWRAAALHPGRPHGRPRVLVESWRTGGWMNLWRPPARRSRPGDTAAARAPARAAAGVPPPGVDRVHHRADVGRVPQAVTAGRILTGDSGSVTSTASPPGCCSSWRS